MPDTRFWKNGKIRAFVTHLAAHKGFASDVAAELEPRGVHGFVAHNSIQVSLEWQGVIEAALSSAQVLVGLAHPDFAQSHWCHQEIGWAYGRQIPVFIVRLGEVPLGFPASRQWPSMEGASASEVASAVVTWLNQQAEFSGLLGDAAIEALRGAGHYEAARDAALQVEEYGQLTDAQLDSLGDAFWANDQIHGSVWASPIVHRIFKAHDRSVPERPE